MRYLYSIHMVGYSGPKRVEGVAEPALETQREFEPAQPGTIREILDEIKRLTVGGRRSEISTATTKERILPEQRRKITLRFHEGHTIGPPQTEREELEGKTVEIDRAKTIRRWERATILWSSRAWEEMSEQPDGTTKTVKKTQCTTYHLEAQRAVDPSGREGQTVYDIRRYDDDIEDGGFPPEFDQVEKPGDMPVSAEDELRESSVKVDARDDRFEKLSARKKAVELARRKDDEKNQSAVSREEAEILLELLRSSVDV